MLIPVNRVVAVEQSQLPSPINDAKKNKVIDFQFFISPFIQLLAGAGVNVLIKKSIAIAHYCERMVTAYKIILRRLFFAPPFRPNHPSFKKLIDQMENRVPVLQKRIDDLGELFWQKHLISRDVSELKKIRDEIAKDLSRLNFYCNALEGRKKPFPIQPQLTQVRTLFRDLDDQLTSFCEQKEKDIVGKFEEAVILFNKGGVVLPKEILKQLKDTLADLNIAYAPLFEKVAHSISDPIANQLSNIKKMIQSLERQAEDVKSAGGIKEPLKLRNIGSSCYMDSALQALLCISHIREKFKKPIEYDHKSSFSRYEKKQAIQKEIRQFMVSQERHQKDGGAMTQLELFLFLFNEGPSLHSLRKAIFNSELHYGFDPNKISKQNDPALLVDLFIEQFLSDCSFQFQQFKKADQFPGLKFLIGSKDQTASFLTLPLYNKSKKQKLQVSLQEEFGERKNPPNNPFLFDPKNGIVILGEEEKANKSKQEAPAKIDDHKVWSRLTKAPPVLVIKFRRASDQMINNQVVQLKDKRPVILPEDGIIDLSKYYDPVEGEAKNARYRIKSIVRHVGDSFEDGHYDSFVEINGKYFHCDDSARNCYKEISKEDFLGRKDPYLLFLERMPDEGND